MAAAGAYGRYSGSNFQGAPIARRVRCGAFLRRWEKRYRIFLAELQGFVMNWPRSVLIVFHLLFLARTAFADTRVALVFGNSAYVAVGSLPNPQSDAALIADTLKSDGFAVTLVQNASRAAMLQALNSFNDQADGADWAVVYYAGHGIEVGGTNYLLPTDAQLRVDRDAQDEGVSLNRVLDTVASARKLRIVILDACRNNPFATAMRRSVATRAVERGLSRPEPQAGIMVVYSAAAGEVAEDGAGGHSPFTAALAGRLKQPGIEVSRLFNVVTADVLAATGQRQRPYQYGSNPSTEELFFTPSSAAPSAMAPPTPTQDERLWSFLKVSKDPATLAAFRDGLPTNSPLRADVQARLAAVSAEQVAALRFDPAMRLKSRGDDDLIDACDRAAVSPYDTDRPPGVKGVDFDSIDTSTAIRLCRRAVEAAPSERRPLANLGRALMAAKTYEEAKVALDKAAAAGSTQAMLNLGVAYENGEGVPQDYATGRSWYEKAVARGDSASMVNLGLMAMNGKGGAKSPTEAARWFRRAADAGNRVGMTQLGLAYAFGNGVEKDLTEAVRWYRKGAVAGDPMGMRMLGSAYSFGNGVEKDSKEAVHWSRKAADAGDASAMFDLGFAYDSGNGVEKDSVEAAHWYRKAADAGSAEAMVNLGKIYEDGLGVDKDNEQAAHWFRKASDAGAAAGMHNLAMMYESGSGVAQDLNEAARLYHKAADAGIPESSAALKRLQQNRRNNHKRH